ncbi:N-terminal nucleophile aminohydrolase [Daldinia decipiens]|uniref:N-terminal nucleophile aminohydrolase n=1 Tax=Daldinia decipiens TaxID=326647 RepID=UPI0020C3ABB8|nr:N-terminal nucleophile aminohydrolase [Daldinia decipiens]KAI1659189.1 N-terminal nucleophile aminohydrolase [Daldinia decipiens]
MDFRDPQDNAVSTWHEDDIEQDDIIDGLPWTTEHPRPPSPLEDGNIVSMDGAIDRWGKRKRFPVAAIFIHAGAGYHSVANESLHLEACNEAARLSIKLLRSGHSAVDAVEAAIKSLEDKEITNAGYGSNLAIDGTVECDATLVDHFGRSGACGAVPNVKNPISLAKIILLSSNKPLSLRRVPPNLLIGEGAKEFARESGMILIPNQFLVSKNARDRYVRWQEDMRRAESKTSLSLAPNTYDRALDDHGSEIRQNVHPDHTTAILTGTWNEGQPDSLALPSSPWDNGPSVLLKLSSAPQVSPKNHVERSSLSFLGSLTGSKTVAGEISSSTSKRPRFSPGPNNESLKSDPSTSISKGLTKTTLHDETNSNVPVDLPMPKVGQAPTTMATPCLDKSPPFRTADHHKEDNKDVDEITDTVGAIAIDMSGKIAAGSSSGGIGMKHRGRIGPAALVGIGTAVIPIDERDQDGIAVAAVTSGTGEHMATTMASQKCAERIYQRTRRGPGGKDIAEDDENAILQGFIANDFQEHPGVKYSSSAGAIGIMAVKKGPLGYYLYFAHNTDSFAVASMGSNDIQPACVMSRIKEGSSGLARIAQGGRKIHI